MDAEIHFLFLFRSESKTIENYIKYFKYVKMKTTFKGGVIKLK